MHETIIAAGNEARPHRDAVAAANLRLLACWLLHCHERTRQRGQLGVLASAFGDAEPEPVDASDKRDEPTLSWAGG